MPVLSLDQIKPNNTEAGTRSLSIIRLVMWEGQVTYSSFVTQCDLSLGRILVKKCRKKVQMKCVLRLDAFLMSKNWHVTFKKISRPNLSAVQK